ncbi:thrombospondin-2-like [Mytilus californianus]|uniref:thrombospondin-2-like n=1 Tax=Mytilus californianus TaxID=6549 RepID=UPI002245948C|nr:thrombospondin-2-like [Mytilus californianus]
MQTRSRIRFDCCQAKYETDTDDVVCTQTKCPDLESWSVWANLGECSVTCQEGKQYQTRHRFLPLVQINETVIKENVCYGTKCPESWSVWANLGGCSVTCGEGKQYQTKHRFLPLVQMNETVIKENFCYDTKCPESWSVWANLGGCSVTCGEGKQYQTKHRFLPLVQINETVIKKNVCYETKCPVFKWINLKSENLTIEDKKEMMKGELVDLKANLTIDKKNTSAAIRRRTSARDNRPFATLMGYVGVIILIIPVVLIIYADFTKCCQSKKISRKKKVHPRLSAPKIDI